MASVFGTAYVPELIVLAEAPKVTLLGFFIENRKRQLIFVMYVPFEAARGDIPDVDTAVRYMGNDFTIDEEDNKNVSVSTIKIKIK